MYCINYRIGIMFRENSQKQTYEIRYFFIDDDANLIHILSLARLQKIIRLSSDFKQIRQKLIKFGQKSYSLHNYILTNPGPYESKVVIPFSNRTCFKIKPDESKKNQYKQPKEYQIFGFLDQDTPLLHHQILVLTGQKKAELNKRKSVIEDEKNRQQKKLMDFFNKYIQNEQKFKMQNLETNKEIEFICDNEEGKAEGKCLQTLVSQGISYNGQFYQGKKHGEGLLVNTELDSLNCQFIEDQLVGI